MTFRFFIDFFTWFGIQVRKPFLKASSCICIKDALRISKYSGAHHQVQKALEQNYV